MAVLLVFFRTRPIYREPDEFRRKRSFWCANLYLMYKSRKLIKIRRSLSEACSLVFYGIHSTFNLANWADFVHRISNSRVQFQFGARGMTMPVGLRGSDVTFRNWSLVLSCKTETICKRARAVVLDDWLETIETLRLSERFILACVHARTAAEFLRKFIPETKWIQLFCGFKWLVKSERKSNLGKTSGCMEVIPTTQTPWGL